MSDDRVTIPNVEPAPSAAISETARQDLDDLTVLSNVTRQDLDTARLTVARSVEVDDGKFGALSLVHQGSRSAPQVTSLHVNTSAPLHPDVTIDIAEGHAGAIPEIPALHIRAMEGGGMIRPLAPTGLTVTMATGETAVHTETTAVAAAPVIETGPAAAGIAVSETAAAAEAATVIRTAAGDAVDIVPAVLIVTPLAETVPATEVETPNPEVPPENRSPTALDLALSGSEDATVGFTLSYDDADGDALNVTLGTPAHGTVTFDAATGRYLYAPDSDWNGHDLFSYTVADPEGASVTRDVTVDIAAVADAPGLVTHDVSIDLSQQPGQVMTGTGGPDTLTGGPGADIITGGGGNDVLQGDGGGGVTVPLDISAVLSDIDGSEYLGPLTISGLPADASLSAGLHNTDGSWTLSADQLPGLNLTTDGTAGFDITVTASAIETSNQDSAVTSAVLHVDITGGGTGGDDTLVGGTGDDLFRLDADGRDIIDGGAGKWTDTLDLSNLTAEGHTVTVHPEHGQDWTVSAEDHGTHVRGLGHDTEGTVTVDGQEIAEFTNIEKIIW